MRANLDLIIANLLFGVNYSVILSLLGGWLTIEQLFLVQIVVGAVIFAPWLIPRRGERHITWGDLAQIAALALLTLYGWNFLLLKGGESSSTMDIASLAALGPSFTLIASYLLHRERVNLRRVAGIVLSLVGGVVLITSRITSEGGAAMARGNLLVMLSTLCMALNTVLIKGQLARHGAARLLAHYFALAFVVTLPMMGREVVEIDLKGGSAQHYAELFYITTLGMALPLYLLYIGVGRSRPIYSAIFRYLQPLIALIVALAQGGVQLERLNLAAMAVMLVGFLLILLTRGVSVEARIK